MVQNSIGFEWILFKWELYLEMPIAVVVSSNYAMFYLKVFLKSTYIYMSIYVYIYMHF